MAQIKYLDSRRIMGASTDIVENLNYVDENYSSSTGWTQVSTNIAISNGKVQFSSGLTATSRIYKALPFTADNTKWIIDFELLYSTAGNGDQIAPLCISDGTDHPTGSATNSICVHSYHNGAGVTNDTVSVSYRDGGSLTNVFQLGTNLTNGTRYYMRLERTSSTNVKLTAYSNSARTSSVTTNNGTIPSTLDGLTTIHHSSHHTTGAAQTAEIDNLKFYDGVTGTPFTVTYKPSLTPAVTGGWVQVGRTTLQSAGDDITVSNLSNKTYYMVLGDLRASGGIDPHFRFNGNTSGYSYRYSDNGGTDGTGINSGIMLHGVGNSTTNQFAVSFISNYPTGAKFCYSIAMDQNTAGASNVPNRSERVSKDSQASVAINTINSHNSGAGNYDTGSEIVILGWNPDDTHTTNFWEELADVTASGSSTTLSSGTITAKKYLWIQTYIHNPDSTAMRFNGDGASTGTYARRGSLNGDATPNYSVASTHQSFVTYSSNPSFTNYFIINNQSNEKLCMWHSIDNGGSGAGNIPNRKEEVFKWTNTSNQITQIDLINSSANIDSSSFIKVWGAD